MPWDSPAEMLAASRATEEMDPAEVAAELDLPLPDDDDEAPTADVATEPGSPDEPAAEDAAEPLAEYAARLAALDPATAVPYRPWATYEVGQCVQHLAWDDCGVVVDKESLPGGRRVIKCYFAEAGVVRLIEQAPR